jgi:hypothetical protein
MGEAALYRVTAGWSAGDLLESVAVELAELDRSTCVACLVSDDREWIQPVGFHSADPAGQRGREAALPERVLVSLALEVAIAQTQLVHP